MSSRDETHTVANYAETEKLSIFNDDIFTFLVGPQLKPFHVHGSIFVNISKPLHSIINSGMQESRAKQAKLEEIDPNTFDFVIRYAYGQYAFDHKAVRPGNREGIVDSVTQPICACPRCSTSSRHSSPTLQPFCSVTCKHELKYAKTMRLCYCALSGCRNTWSYGTWPSACLEIRHWLCDQHKVQAAQEERKRTFELISEFKSETPTQGKLKSFQSYAGILKGTALVTALADVSHDDRSGSKLLESVRLYIAAEMWMINQLKEVALKRLHNQLASLQLTKTDIEILAHVISFAYDNTPAEGDIMAGTSDRLRCLLMAYIKSRIPQLRTSELFMSQMSKGGQQTGDFIKVLCKSKAV